MSERAESLAGGVALGEDLACMGCGYNLRTLLPSQRCPECGTPVVKSVEAGAAVTAVSWLSVAAGATLLIVWMWLPWFWEIRIAIHSTRQAAFWNAVEMTVHDDVLVGLFVCGFICLARSTKWPRGQMRVWRFGVWTLLALVVILCVFRSVQWWLPLPAVRAFLRAITDSRDCLDLIFQSILFALAAIFLRRLARERARPKWGLLLMTMLLATAVLLLPMAAVNATYTDLYHMILTTPVWLHELTPHLYPRLYRMQHIIQMVVWPAVIAWALWEWWRQRRNVRRQTLPKATA